MRCLSPIDIRKPDSKSYMLVPCGKCEACLLNRQNAWTVRLREEQKVSDKSYFFTLTYDEHNVPLFINDFTGEVLPTLRKDDVSAFMKRLRNHFASRTLKFYAIGEYGTDTQRPHYHGILFLKSPKTAEYVYDSLSNSWQKGFIKLDVLNENRIKYVSGYFLNKLQCPDDVQKPFSLMSKGLGLNYVDTMYDWHKSTQNFYAPYFDKKQPLPRYYKDKIFSVREKKQFAEKCFWLAEDKLQQDLEEANGSYEELHKNYTETRLATARQIAKSHKKKML